MSSVQHLLHRIPGGVARTPAERSGLADLSNEQVVRLGLFLLVTPGAIIGLTALFFPRYFYDEFFLGASWLTVLGPYNEHQIVWLGGIYLALTAGTVYAMVRTERCVVRMVCWAQVLGAFPHMCFHLSMWRMSGVLDTLLQAGVLGLTWVVALAVIYFENRRRVSTALVPRHPDLPRTGARTAMLLGLWVIMIPSVVIGAVAIVTPRYYYRGFPFGAGWEQQLGAYTSHLIIDIGSLNAALAVGAALTLLWRTPETVRALGWVVVAGTVPHLVYLLWVQNELNGRDRLLFAGFLAVVVLAGLLVLVANARQELVSVTVAEGEPLPRSAVRVIGGAGSRAVSHGTTTGTGSAHAAG